MTLIEAAKQAREALKGMAEDLGKFTEEVPAIAALDQAIIEAEGRSIAEAEQPQPDHNEQHLEMVEQQEPVYHLRQFGDVTKEQLDRYNATGDINPQPEEHRQAEGAAWQGLTDDAIWEVMAQVNWTYHPPTFARAIEAALKEKNT